MRLIEAIAIADEPILDDGLKEVSKLTKCQNSKFNCYRCGIVFEDLVEMREHFKYHTVHQQAEESENTDSIRPYVSKVNGKLLFFLNKKPCSVWACFLHANIGTSDITESFMRYNLKQFKNTQILVILLRAGNFASGVFNVDGIAIATKTIHKYTIRAGRGFSQSKAGGSKQYHSAGSQIRAENEKKLMEEIYVVFHSWAGHIQLCPIIVWNFTPAGEKLLLGDKSPLRSRKESFRTIPFEIYEPCQDELFRTTNKLLNQE